MRGTDAEAASRVLNKRFSDAIGAGRVSTVERIDDCCVLAVVGQGMVARKGVAATMMSALAKANVNIKAIAQVGGGLVVGRHASRGAHALPRCCRCCTAVVHLCSSTSASLAERMGESRERVRMSECLAQHGFLA